MLGIAHTGGIKVSPASKARDIRSRVFMVGVTYTFSKFVIESSSYIPMNPLDS